jgi:hypothetical protein
MRIFDLSRLTLLALVGAGTVVSASVAFAQSAPDTAQALLAPPAPVAANPLPPLPSAAPAPVAAPLPLAGHVLATPATPQPLRPGNEDGDATPAFAPAPLPHKLEPFKSIRDAFTRGMRGYNAGDKVDAARAFAYAAAQGHAMSSWKLARMYAGGDGVPQDDLKAFEYYSKIADEDGDEGPSSPNARFIANAYVALGTYFLDGIPHSYVKLDPARARSLFEYAATLFGDPDAQYNLARMLADGTGGPKDVRQAVRWLNLAAEKHHRPSEALLGHILFTGNGVPRQAAQGLMWLSLARDGADPAKYGWIIELRDKAFAAATDNERQLATLYIDQHKKGR